MKKIKFILFMKLTLTNSIYREAELTALNKELELSRYDLVRILI